MTAMTAVRSVTHFEAAQTRSGLSLYAVCDDGSVWCLPPGLSDWKEHDPVPGTLRHAAREAERYPSSGVTR